MLIGVVSDTHNNLVNISKIVSIFNKKRVEQVIHTGDITNKTSLRKLSALECPLSLVYGNNDREEEGLEEVAAEFNFTIQEPPLFLEVANKKISVFHEPDEIPSLLSKNKNLDFIFHGHTHRYTKEKINKTLIFNPGESAGLMKGKNSIGIVDLITSETERIFF